MRCSRSKLASGAIDLSQGPWHRAPSPNNGRIAAISRSHSMPPVHIFARFLIGLFCLHQTALADTLSSYPNYTGQYTGFSLLVDERFDALDERIWKKGDGAVGSESLCRFTPQGVRIKDGVLQLVVEHNAVAASFSEDHQQHKPAYDYTCGELRTRADQRLRYGRIETRMRAPERTSASGYISSLFTYVNEAQSEYQEWEEIDVELEGGRPDKFQANLIYGRNTVQWWATRDYGAWEDKIEIGPVDSWRVYAIEWLPDQISWFIDGRRIKTLKSTDLDCKPKCLPPQKYPTPIPDNATDVMINFWIPNDVVQDNFGGNKRHNRYPMIASYDWLRIYRYDVEASASGQTSINPNRLQHNRAQP